jgi:D-glycero-D-manno-heptose 1,7-bisphosphate phosphatase
VKPRAVFLDRDGVINYPVVREGKPYPPSSAEEFEIISGVPEALRMLRDAGFLLICVTNQPDVARGTQQREEVERMHKMLISTLPLDDILACYHDDRDNCHCRKPLPGMLMDAAQKWSISLPESFMIGDRWRDIEAGSNAGCSTLFIEYGYSEQKPKLPPDMIVLSLLEAAKWILKQI